MPRTLDEKGYYDLTDFGFDLFRIKLLMLDDRTLAYVCWLGEYNDLEQVLLGVRFKFDPEKRNWLPDIEETDFQTRLDEDAKLVLANPDELERVQFGIANFADRFPEDFYEARLERLQRLANKYVTELNQFRTESPQAYGKQFAVWPTG